ncbi:hypothetical protein CLIB1423_05S00320 [[Candida] railenensis]|uniref:Protein IBD2 n=1 Tax=[Candida] railenensis TaxID=45579 RepID=A0A9P0QM97_9ASCO|nr:hypothetical protein CLIB1423_05S00320 [[Candida] railenensis]
MDKDTGRLDDSEKIDPSKVHKPTGLPLNSNGELDPQSLFELVSKHYNSWSNAIDKQFEDDENFSPFPNENMPSISRSDANGSQQPIFDYSLLEALDKVSSELVRDQKIQDVTEEAEEVEGNGNGKSDGLSEKKMAEIKKMEVIERIQRKYLAKREQEKKRQRSQEQTSSQPQQRALDDNNTLLQESEINYLQDKIAQIFKSNNVAMPKREGFSLYDTQDEEGLHEGNADSEFDGDDDEIEDVVDEGQNDYDIGEISDSMYYDYHPTHHIEVELNTENGENSSRTVFNNQYDYEDDGGPSCEFTFEYDPSGKLIPTHSNVEEKLRLMSLESRMRIGKMLDQKEEEILNKIQPGSGGASGSSKKKKKNKNKNKGSVNEQIEKPDPSCCLFCEYETIYGMRPRQMIKWYDHKMRQEEIRRDEIRKKLESAKSKALKKQRELRQRQHQQLQQQQQQQQQQILQQQLQQQQQQQQQDERHEVEQHTQVVHER